MKNNAFSGDYIQKYSRCKQLFRSMKISTALLLVGALGSYAGNVHSQSAKVNLQMDQVSLNQILNEIESQTNYMFLYNNHVNVDRTTSIHAKDESVAKVLSIILEGTDIKYELAGEHIILTNGNAKTASAIVQKKTIKGKVIDAQGEAIIGANVRIKGTSIGTITDIDGNFTLEVAPNSVIEISYIGYVSQEVNVKGNTPITVKLIEDNKTLKEVVVVGYGVQKKVNLTGSVTSVSSSDLKDKIQTDVLSTLQGTVPGVTIISRPGQDATINFRGRGNLGSSEPLYVIDGAIADAAFFSNLDPNSIENISFLKDASSAAIYGSRAAYGVVLVTTKQGAEGKTNISYSGMVGMKTPTYKLDLVDSWDYAELYNEALYNSNPSGGTHQGFSEKEIQLFKDGSQPDLYPNTDWMDLMFDDWAFTTKHSLNVSGGSPKLRYFAGLGYVQDNENLKNRDISRYNLNLNIHSELNKWLTFKGGIKYIQRNKDIKGSMPSFNNMLIVPSTFVAKQSNGEWGSVEAGHEASSTFAGGNPLRAYSTNDWTKFKIEHSMYELALDIKPIKDIILSGQMTYNTYQYKDKYYTALKDEIPSFLNPGKTIGGTGNTINSMKVNWSNSNLLTYTGTAQYNLSLGAHQVTVLGGVSYEHYQYESLNASRQDFPADTFEDLSAGSTSGSLYQNGSGKQGMQEYKMFSYFGRVNYAFKDRYLFEANFRADASSRFHKNNRWGYFPSFSAGWRLSEEQFMAKTRHYIDNLKIRASYGTLGNINNVGNYDYFPAYGGSSYYPFDNSLSKVIGEIKPANASLSWEKVALMNFGVDFSLWNGLLSGTAEYYLKNTSDILLAYNVPFEVGISQSPSQNVAKVRNRGFELALSHRNQIKKFSYNIGANFSINSNKIVDLASSNNIINNLSGGHGVAKYILKEGESIGSFYGFKSDGLYTQEEIDAGRYYKYGGIIPNAGDTKFVPQRDIAWKEEITDDDRTIIGCEVPKFTYGINLSMNYANFELSAFGQGVSGADVAFEVYQVHPFFHGQDNPRKYHLGRWTTSNPNPHANYPRIYTANNPHTAYNRAFNEYQVFDADYFRLKTLTLGYNIPKSLINQLGITSLKFYITGENLLTLRADKKMKDFDPETAGSTIQALGTKSLAFGVNLSF